MARSPVPLVDSYGRTHRDLRISVTDRCNFRCTYCMPEEGLAWVPRDDVLTFEEIEQVARVCVEHYGFDSIRLTGGEPTVRAHLHVLVAKLAALGADLAMTTNGSVLRAQAPGLRAAGLDRLNISLDSLRPERFLALTRRDELDSVLDGIDAALEAGFDPVKLNVVCMEGVNDDEVVDFATFGRERGVEVRFIEFMPLDADHSWSKVQVVPGERIIAAIDAVYPLRARARGSDPAEVFEYIDGRGRVGAIASVTAPFCARCDRVRLTAEGRLRNCLFSMDETDLRSVLRGGGSDDDLATAISSCVAAKGPGHQIGSVTFVQPPRTMSQIGG
ncbi:MAG: GTP 3',8-cyclase MoaA [Actinomycetota bacterium]|jgi:cyclic pyranopterin phosphate synthase|nr:GTP 3',8-cyclase MoaA [Actinomycetota bacterium]